MRQKAWLSPCPGVGFRAVILWRRYGFARVIYRHGNKCYKTLQFMPSNDLLFERT